MNIGIDNDRYLIYEGSGYYGHAVWPSPVLTAAKIITHSDGPLEAESSRVLVGDALIFREDLYDPIARIRRGRFYKAGNRQPVEWQVQVHPAMLGESQQAMDHILKKRLDTFYASSIWHTYIENKKDQPLVLLGMQKRFTIWTIINIEAIITGEDLVTMKGRSSLGVLPQIDLSRISSKHQAAVLESLDRFVDAVHQSAPVSVIDRARDAASQLLLAYYKSTPVSAQDLGKLATRLENDKKLIGASVAKIVARLHARAKPVEIVRRRIRPIREQDAELATQCIGILLCELGWADWP